MTPPRPLVVATGLLSLVVLANLWVFSRFTVDDAFITWRYGRNLIDHGIWGYNASHFDLTQAYTNPVFAVASIIPAATGMDIVLFFKLVSLLTLAVLGVLFLRAAEDRVRMAFVLVLLLAIPAGVAHAFSGLETWVYGGTLALFFVTTQRQAWSAALACAVLLVLTRPEAWLLFALYPSILIAARVLPREAPIARGLLVGQIAALMAVAALYFGFHVWQFDRFLPNTFYIKSGAGLSPAQALRILPYTLPALLVLAFGDRRTGLAMTLYFAAVGYSYASSDLLMNYLQRFPFQIVLPITLYLGWAVSRRDAVFRVGRGWLTLGIAVYLGAFAVHARGLGDHLGIANYYPRLLDSHVALGRTLHDLSGQNRVHAFALGDAGAPAFHADLPALDTIVLGSRMVADQGLTLDVVTAYAPDVVGFFADAAGIRDLPARHAALWEYVAQTGMEERCELVYAPHYTVRLFTATDLPELDATCARSAVLNGVDEVRYALANLRHPPWFYWHE